MGKISVIIAREFNERVRKKSFIIMTIITPLLMLGIMVAPALLLTMSPSNEKTIYVVDKSGVVAQQLSDVDNLRFVSTDSTYQQLKTAKDEKSTYGFLVIGSDIVNKPSDVQFYCYESPGMEVEMVISSQIGAAVESIKLSHYNIENIETILKEVDTDVTMQSFQIDETGAEKASSALLATIMAYIFGFMIYMFVFVYGAMVMQGVIEEKSSKVLEIMVSSVKPYELMMGKILGIASVALTQLLIWCVFLLVVGGGAMSLFGGDAVAAATTADPASAQVSAMMSSQMTSILASLSDVWFLAKLFGAFIVFFIGGYLLYAAMFAAIGSAVDNITDAQQMQLPVTIPIVLALIVMMNVLREPNSAMAVWFSMIPLTSPIIMMARIPFGVPTWQIVASVAILYASFIFMVWFAGKIYRVGIFMYGKKPTLKEIIRWSRYKY